MTRLSIVFVMLLASACGAKREDRKLNSEKPVVAVVNYPLYYFAKSIGRDLITVYFPAIEGDPADWKPDARQISKFQKADLILDNGAGYAKWMEKVSLPSSRIISTSRDFMADWIEIEEVTTHSHGPEGAHVHTGTATSTWLNFVFAQKQASATLQALIKLLPNHEDSFRKNYNELQKQLIDFDDRMKNVSPRLKGIKIFASHPVYQYLEKAYGLKLNNLHWEPNEMPSVDQWKEFEISRKEDMLCIMFWEDDPLPEIKQRLVELGMNVLVFSPCGNKPSSGDFATNMGDNIFGLEQKLEEILQ